MERKKPIQFFQVNCLNMGKGTSTRAQSAVDKGEKEDKATTKQKGQSKGINACTILTNKVEAMIAQVHQNEQAKLKKLTTR